ncbi:hypothetical protein BCR39DRAFT_469481, partial [Naematelia encephala]
ALPSLDDRRHYDPPMSPESDEDSGISSPPSPYNLTSNSGNKLINSARWIRKGKICAWGPTYEEVKTEQRARRRLKAALQELLPEAALEVGVPPPTNIVEAQAKREARKRKREETYIMPHLASPSPPVSTIKLAPLLALPQSYLDIMMNPSMRYSLGDDTVETGLQRTSGELLEGEKGLMQALGRLREVLRVVSKDVPIPDVPKTNGDSNGHIENGDTPQARTGTPGESAIPPLPHIGDTDNLWRVTQELLVNAPPPAISFTVTQAGTAGPPIGPQPVPTPVQRLFTAPTGITLNAIPPENHVGFKWPPSHPHYPQHVKYNLDLVHQCRAVDDALERIAELLTDCIEYKERLEEARNRVADIARARKKVWSVVKERAGWELDRLG